MRPKKGDDMETDTERLVSEAEEWAPPEPSAAARRRVTPILWLMVGLVVLALTTAWLLMWLRG
jgi:hypothetical protein